MSWLSATAPIGISSRTTEGLRSATALRTAGKPVGVCRGDRAGTPDDSRRVVASAHARYCRAGGGLPHSARDLVGGLYFQALRTPSDISGHLQGLYGRARQCRHVTEM